MFVNDPEGVDKEIVEEEAKHLRKVLNTFTLYKSHALTSNNRRRTDYYALPERHKALIPDYLTKLNKVDHAISKNYHVLKQILSDGKLFVGDEYKGSSNNDNDDKEQVTEYDMDKLRSTIKQFVREWAIEGKPERDATYKPLLDALNEFFKDVSKEERASIRVLVPGAGLGRLAFDIVQQGFSCQGNEFSFYMLLASHFILNRIERVHQHEIYPFIHSFSNIVSSDDQLKPIFIPDILPSSIPPDSNFSMVAGDFVEVYGEEQHIEKWDCIVTCFFIDTAKNIIEYIEIFHRILKPGGLWINIGPLLYHYENSPGEMSIELSLDQVKCAIKETGFLFQDEKIINTTYTSNPNGMLKYVYECSFWTCVKQ
ncbi:S-adenosylmethionine-dependent methyltransferase [Rhizophagus diaphanus]|nr:S-adenosylmethionine-dependent methyltransferase [Rhizophagus diaphanus] [Rhizophagus sp. MUCL 43196]